MPSSDKELAEVERRLGALVRCVMARAESDGEFADQLKEIFLSDTLRSSLKQKRSASKGRRAVFDPVGFLNSHDGARLRKELDKPLGELRDIARAHKILPAQSLREMERGDLINKIIDYAERKADQGGVFSEPAPRGKREQGAAADGDGPAAPSSDERSDQGRTDHAAGAAHPPGASTPKPE